MHIIVNFVWQYYKRNLIFWGFAHRVPAEAFPTLKKPPQARLGSLLTCPPGNSCFGTPVYTMVYIFAGEAIFQVQKKPVSYML